MPTSGADLSPVKPLLFNSHRSQESFENTIWFFHLSLPSSKHCCSFSPLGQFFITLCNPVPVPEHPGEEQFSCYGDEQLLAKGWSPVSAAPSDEMSLLEVPWRRNKHDLDQSAEKQQQPNLGYKDSLDGHGVKLATFEQPAKTFVSPESFIYLKQDLTYTRASSCLPRHFLVSFRKHPDFTTMQCKSLPVFLFLIFTLPEARPVTAAQCETCRLTPTADSFVYNPFLLDRCV